MDQIQEFFSNLTGFQWLLIGAAAFLLWPTVSKLFSEDKDEKKVNKPEEKEDEIEIEDEDYDLTSLVYKWESFSDACHEHGLHDACNTLKGVFPLLVKPYEDDHQPKPQPPKPPERPVE